MGRIEGKGRIVEGEERNRTEEEKYWERGREQRRKEEDGKKDLKRRGGEKGR